MEDELKNKKRKKNNTYFNKFGEEQISVYTNINKSTYDEIKESGTKLNHIIELGLRAFKDNPQLMTRIREVEETIKNQHNIIRSHTERIHDLNEKINALNNIIGD